MDRQTLAAYDLDAAAFARTGTISRRPVTCRKSSSGSLSGAASRPISAAVAAVRSPGSTRTAFRPWASMPRKAGRRGAAAIPRFEFARAELPELRGVGTYDNVLGEL